jgi:hypothetical protein
VRAPPAALALALLLAGCLGPGAPPAADEGPRPAPGGVGQDRPEPTFGDVTTGPGVGPDLNATLAAPPRLVPGEWWRIRFTSPLDGTSAEYVRVVAAVQGQQYVVGMPHAGWYKEAVIYHAPAFGDVNGDLSYDSHDEHFVPLQFPLEDGASWTTTFSGGPDMTASVAVTSPYEATVTFTATLPGGPLPGQEAQEQTLLTVVYDARIHEVREFRHGIVEYEVVEHGYGFEGWVTIPRGEDLVFFHGRGLGVLGLGGPSQGPQAPTETVRVAGGYNRVTFIQAVGGFDQPTPGQYRILARAPDGQEFVTEGVPTGELRITFHEHNAPDGDWEVEYLALGQGVAFLEGIAYHQYDIRLPDGALRSDHAHDVIR